MAKYKKLFWFDLETTGTKEHEDPILEIAWIITDPVPPFTELAHGSLVVDPSIEHPGWRKRLEENEYVFNMHTENGLLADIDAGIGHSTEFAEDLVIASLEEHGKKHEFLAAGSGVSHFDRRMIAAQMPRLASWLQYPNHDVGNLRRAFEMLPGGEDFVRQVYGANILATDGTKHRAADDIRDHLNEWRVYSQLLTTTLATVGAQGATSS